MNTRRIWELTARKLANEATAEELQELLALLRDHPDAEMPAGLVDELWQKTTAAASEETAIAAHDRHIGRMQAMGIPIGQATPVTYGVKPGTVALRPRRRYLWAAAVSTGLLLCMGAWWWTSAKKNNDAIASEVTTRNGSRTSIQLADGTRVWLNAGSKLSYSKDFGKNDRSVTLSGEAFFDVAKQADRPFVIHTETMDIRVLGTRFNVRSYPQDKTTEASLITGSIEAIVKHNATRIILKPSEKIVVLNQLPKVVPATRTMAAKEENPVTLSHVSYYAAQTTAITETSWMDNKLVFKDESFATLAREMERFFGVKVRFDNPQPETLRFTGIFEQETVQQALNALQLTAAFRYEIQNDTIIIH
ncbi:FecR family protein [Chitinophaga oryzae]|uniref:FecR family protein n=1 Tax=Chitinophaga oryzae TaxID=2725414 RepID=A0AAE6ZH54_9BACT|nr:FecR family protein [Chitinophaga oryzae]QJB33035.1 FecR family protein [Chitinophaga oryzae]QJB39509.1 FecR family protein [Chitinophaga oryzae]